MRVLFCSITFFFLASFHVPQTGLELSNTAENGVELLILLPLPNWYWGYRHELLLPLYAVLEG